MVGGSDGEVLYRTEAGKELDCPEPEENDPDTQP